MAQRVKCNGAGGWTRVARTASAALVVSSAVACSDKSAGSDPVHSAGGANLAGGATSASGGNVSVATGGSSKSDGNGGVPSASGGSSIASSGGSPTVGGGTSLGGAQGSAGFSNSSAGGGAVGGAGGGTSVASDTKLAVSFADSIIKRWPDPRNITDLTRQWDYNNGIVLRGMQEVWKKTRDARYLAYIKKYVDYFVDASGNLYVDSARTMLLKNQMHSLDLIQPAILLLFLSEQYPSDTRYQTAATGVRNQFSSFPTNSDGGFWHKQTYPNEMWLDGIYMAEPFLAKFGSMNASCGTYCNDTPVAQATLLASHVNLSSGLLLHGWDYDHNATWCLGACAGPTGSGRAPEVWGRATGWYAAALVDILEYLPTGHSGRTAFLTSLQGLATGVGQYQDAATGLWCQVLDKCDRSDNWTESSGTGLLVYALKTGVDRGYLDSSQRLVALRAFNGLVASKIANDTIGPIINDVADGMSIQSSYANYVAIPRRSNSYHGLCAIQLAAAAMEY